MRVSVIGGSRIDDETYDEAYEVGRLLGKRGHTVVCGGLGGTMEAVCKGAREAVDSASDCASGAHGAANSEEAVETIGILPTERPADANEWVTTPIATGMGNARNVMVVLNGEATIAIDGAAGTLSELGHALDFHRPVAGLDTHEIALDGFEAVESPKAAVEFVEAATE